MDQEDVRLCWKIAAVGEKFAMLVMWRLYYMSEGGRETLTARQEQLAQQV